MNRITFPGWGLKWNTCLFLDEFSRCWSLMFLKILVSVNLDVVVINLNKTLLLTLLKRFSNECHEKFFFLLMRTHYNITNVSQGLCDCVNFVCPILTETISSSRDNRKWVGSKKLEKEAENNKYMYLLKSAIKYCFIIKNTVSFNTMK